MEDLNGAGGWENQTASEPGYSEGKPDGAPGQDGHGGGGECHLWEEEELAEVRGAEDEDAKGGGLAGIHHRPAAHPQGAVLGPLEGFAFVHMIC